MELSTEKGNDQVGNRVALVFDERMCRHDTPDGDDHPECPDRIRAIWNKLRDSGVVDRCVVFNAKEAEDKYILSVHSKDHVDLIRNISSKQFDSKRNKIASRFNSIYLNKGSSEAAYLAAGSVIEAVDRVAKGDVNSAFAIVRPPGHHAEYDEPMGFCLFNNVAAAASYVLNERQELGVQKILIVDWDVHHGNGTQKTFWKDSRVLFFSVHRHDFGSFYPANDNGSHNMIGEGPGAGYNINVPWEHGRCGDPDYLAVWDYILIPVAKEFNPDLIIVSAGFDAAVRDPLGGCCLTPYGYSVMLRKLMDFAQGKIVLALEGGYNLQSLANSALACVEVLLDGKPIAGSSEAYPFESTWRVIETVRRKLSAYWSTLADELPMKLTNYKAPPSKQYNVVISDSESENFADLVEDIIKPLSELKVEGHDDAGQRHNISAIWRSQLSKIDIWYATYGSNMWKHRFLCYIEGGQVEGMRKPCPGSMDRSPPKEILWKRIPHRLFFGRDQTATWGTGGVAFLHPESNSEHMAYICMYKITLEQFNDVLYQENISSYEISSPFFDEEALMDIRNHHSLSLEPLKRGWYHNVVYLGEERGIPILTMTCELVDFENFRSGKLPLRAPSEKYANTLIRGLVEGEQLSETDATTYIHECAAAPL
ncbi:Histone deacetylase 5, variant 2 [Ancistrocladus abbreviatus]